MLWRPPVGSSPSPSSSLSPPPAMRKFGRAELAEKVGADGGNFRKAAARRRKQSRSGGLRRLFARPWASLTNEPCRNGRERAKAAREPTFSDHGQELAAGDRGRLDLHERCRRDVAWRRMRHLLSACRFSAPLCSVQSGGEEEASASERPLGWTIEHQRRLEGAIVVVAVAVPLRPQLARAEGA